MDESRERMIFSRSGALLGARRAISLVISDFVYGLVWIVRMAL